MPQKILTDKSVLTEQEFSSLFAKFTIQNPFYSLYSSICNKMATDKVPTICVALSRYKNQYNMFYNLEWCSQFSEEELFEIFKHELLHIILSHLDNRRLTVHGRLANIAQDLAINCLLNQTYLPKMLLLPGREPFRNFPFGLSSEQYLKLLMEKQLSEEQIDKIEENVGQHEIDEEVQKNLTHCQLTMREKKSLKMTYLT
jgi:predicted metal-dependent peptidase